ncbi:MAG: hypothetical protein RR945_09070 [Erysipelotrichaceae bacterium]
MKIIDKQMIDSEKNKNITFIRIQPENLSETIQEIIKSLTDLAWIAQFDKKYVRESFQKRASDSAQYLSEKLSQCSDDQVTKDVGEYVVSELSRTAIVNELKYLDIPLAELFKEQVSGNPGFDYYSENCDNIIIFGEAKYLARDNAYGRGMEQVSRFIEEEQDISDLNDIDKFFNVISLEAANNGDKAYSIGFSSKKIPTDKLIENIKHNQYFKSLEIHKELIFVAVNI